MSKAKRGRRRHLAREQRCIERRLAEAVAPNGGGPVLGRANVGYELSGRSRGTAHGGMGMVARLVPEVGLAAEIDASVAVLAQHRPYDESDHVLNIAYNALCGGTRLENIDAPPQRRGVRVRLRRQGQPRRQGRRYPRAGWFGTEGDPGGGRFTPVVPARIVDTRLGLEGGRQVIPAAPIPPGGTLTVALGAQGGIPPGAAGVSALVLNVAVTGPGSAGWITVYPAWETRPYAS